MLINLVAIASTYLLNHSLGGALRTDVVMSVYIAHARLSRSESQVLQTSTRAEQTGRTAFFPGLLEVSFLL